MRRIEDQLRYSPTDLANHINCKHLTELNKMVARGVLEKPEPYFNPSLKALREKGMAFEDAYLEQLQEAGLTILQGEPDTPLNEERTVQGMQEGVDVIFQAQLKSDKWEGRADFLRKVDVPSKLGDWSYEVWDTKLATTTKVSTIVQIGLYSQRIAEIQGAEPEFMRVIKPNGEDKYRYHDYAAYIRLLQRRFEASLLADTETYPEPVAHCDICRWWKKCNAQRRADDHLTFIAGMGKNQIAELKSQQISTLAQLAEQPNPVSFTPKRGRVHTFNSLRDQAKIQKDSRDNNFERLHQLLPLEEGRGLYLLPKPNKHDIFLDFEGARMVEPDGLDYLIGYYYRGEYTALWAKNEKEEAEIFKQFVSWAYELWQKEPGLHIYHYAPYETTALKRLMGKYVTYENEIDEFLRGKVFVDLYRVLRQSLIASVERYSLKDLEPFFGYERKMDLRMVSGPKSAFEYLLEIGKPEEAVPADLEVIERYNQDDCRALISLQNWLEEIRAQEEKKGHEIPRPEPEPAEASEKITEHQKRIQPLVDSLLKDVPAIQEERSEIEQARFILAHFLDWYRREKKSTYWELYRLKELKLEELLDERKAVSYLEYTKRSYKEKQSRVDIYRFPLQEADLKEEALHSHQGDPIGNIHSIDLEKGILEIKKGPKYKDVEHPSAVIQIKIVSAEVKEKSNIRFAQWVIEKSLESEEEDYRVARNLLLRKAPEFPQRKEGQNHIDYSVEVLKNMDGDYLAIQGPPGAGKSYTGSNLILRLIQEGKKIGVTAMSHKVITHLLQKTYDLLEKEGINASMIQRINRNDLPWTTVKNNKQVLSALKSHQIIAGTSFMWASEDLYEAVDYMFVDEAGQLALIDTIALAHAARNLVLLGDPNQLQQPQQGVHPAGTEVSALEHILNGQQTIQEDQGVFLGTTWRMHPSINTIVSELFYQNRLQPEAHLANQGLSGSTEYQPGLCSVQVEHEGNASSSEEEAEAIEKLVAALTNGTLSFTNSEGRAQEISANDVKIISPYNAQVNLLKERLPDFDIGTVDKFQGQEAPVIIYSVACSSPEEAPRGMDFLYSPNRLNVAISRAKVLFIMVSTPHVFEVECKSPKEMKLANAFCRFAEAAYTPG